MALVVDKTVKFLSVPDNENFTIECSKPCSQLSVDDIRGLEPYVGFISKCNNQIFEGKVSSGSPNNDPDHCWCWATDASASANYDWNTAHWSYPANAPEGVYMRNVLVECASAHMQNTVLQNDASARIVLNVTAGADTNMQKLYIQGNSFVTCPYGDNLTSYTVTDNRYIKPAVLMIFEAAVFLWIQGTAPVYHGYFCDDPTTQGYLNTEAFGNFAKIANHRVGLGWTRALETGNMYTDSGIITPTGSYTIPDTDFNGITADLNVTLGYVNYNKRASLSVTDNEDKEIEKWYKAFTGFKFKVDDVWYKPIVQGGIVTGYTDDMTITSEWDEWDNITGHNVPITPPVPPSPTGDDIDKQHFGGGTALGGAENLWLLTTAQMTSLHNAISSCDVPNFEPLNSVISVMGLAIPPTYPLGTDIATLININIRKSDGTLWSTHTEGHICDKQTASFGFTNNIKIKRKYNNFLDYPPYSSHEIFLPLCGWLPLPAYAVGRNLTVYYVHDINTCSVRGLVFCEGSLIGEKYGTMGANIPFSSSGHSLYVGGLITGGVQTLADFATAVSSKGPIALMSAIQGVAEGANTLLASNQNRTSVIGQNQDRTSFADGQYIRIKSTYPDVKIEENFGHTFGFVCNKKGQLKDFKGFTTCENPHVYGFSCTSEEKDEIERLLKAGIIINIPEK